MKLKALALFLLLFHSTHSWAGAKISSVAQGGALGPAAGFVGNSGNSIEKWVDSFPDNRVRTGLKEYLRLVNPKAYQGSSVGGSNRGLVRFFGDRFKDNRCFNNTAIQFYSEIAQTLKQQNQCPFISKQSTPKFCHGIFCGIDSTGVETDYGCFSKRPGIDSQVGKGNKTYLKEGWLLQLALKHSGGNPEAALELIGMCGHDDIVQGKYHYSDSSEAGKNKLRAQIEKFKSVREHIAEEIRIIQKSAIPDADRLMELRTQHIERAEEIEQVRWKLNQSSVPTQLMCPPQESDFFLPGALSGNADIPASLKEKIKKVQGHGLKDVTVIPAKHYHVYGSALLGCKMVQNGLNRVEASIVQTQAARMYRGFRMCEESNSQIKSRNTLKAFGIKDVENTTEVESKILEIWEQKNKNVIDCGQKLGTEAEIGMGMMTGFSKAGVSPKDDAYEKCALLDTFNIVGLGREDREAAQKKIAGALGRMDAAMLYRSWYVGGTEVLGIQIPCTDWRLKGPTDLMNANQGILGNLYKPEGWTKERYDAANKRVATWEVDFEWTIAQHSAGSKFGAELCADAKNKKNPFEAPGCNIARPSGGQAGTLGQPEQAPLPPKANKSSK